MNGEAMAPDAPTLNIYQRLNAVMKDVKIVSKERFQKFDKFNYVGHDDVTDPLHDAFAKHGVFQHVELKAHARRDDQSFWVEVAISWINVDQPDDKVQVVSFGEAMATRKSGGDDLQYGKAISYAVKVAQLKNFMLVGGEIPDNEEQQPQPAGRSVAPVEQSPERKALAEEQITAFVEQYSGVKTRDDLVEIRNAISTLMNKGLVTTDQEDKLAAADSKAEAGLQ